MLRCRLSIARSGAVRSKTTQRIIQSTPSTRHYAQIQHIASESELPPPPSPIASNNDKRPIRERLRGWEKANPTLVSPILEFHDAAFSPSAGGVANAFASPEACDTFENDDANLNSVEEDIQIRESDLVDFGHDRSFLRPGDLVEFRSLGGTRSELAIYIRDHGFEAQFYSMSGRWTYRSPKSILFFHPHFVNPKDLEPLLAFLPPKGAVDVEDDGDKVATPQLKKLHTLNYSLPRTIGSPLTTKMHRFWESADSIYRRLATKLDVAHDIVAKPDFARYLTLSEVASEIAPDLYTKGEDITTSNSALLYAIHRAVMQDDVGFRPQKHGNFRTWGKFEVTSLNDVKVIRSVTNAVRKAQDAAVVHLGRPTKSSGEPASLTKFAKAAAEMIAESRRSRQFTPYGILGPFNATGANSDKSLDLGRNLGGSHRYFVRFIECWVCLKLFHAASPLNAIGSAILRATGMYKDNILDASTGWTFLQEIGVVSTRTTTAGYELRLPDVAGLMASESRESLREDTVKKIRKDWGQLPVFCIDAARTKEVDDGISIEATTNPKEYWVHVHVADPASQINPHGDIARHAQKMAENVYLPERTTSMLPKSIVLEKFSLANGRPCLTVSWKMNDEGIVLEQGMSTGIVRNVKYLTYETMNEVAEKAERSSVIQSHSSQQSPPPQYDGGVVRKLLSYSELTSNDRNILLKMHEYARVHRRQTSLRGALYSPFPNNNITVSSPQNDADPQITLPALEPDTPRNPPVDPVMHMMLTAGHMTSLWCSRRGIPIIHRASQLNPDKPSPIFYSRQHIIPLYEANLPIPKNVINGYLSLLGSVLPSTTMGPHIALGVKGYCKATSPLRRYADLVTHWQVEATLLEEEKRGKSLVIEGNEGEDDLERSFLPFSTESINALIPSLDSRERANRFAQRGAERAWTLRKLVLAWKFGEDWIDLSATSSSRSTTRKLPKTLKYTVTSVNPRGARGTLDGVPSGILASMPRPESLSMSKDGQLEEDGMMQGDVWEVELSDVNVYLGRLEVRGLRQVR